jgi:iron complex outermembrane recepter protein
MKFEMSKKKAKHCSAGIAVATLFALLSAAVWAADGHALDVRQLSQLSLEELLQVEVTTVSKKAQPLAQVPAAIFVITQDDIRRSGANSLPEVLRLVPGLHVARIDASKWAVSSRGFNGRFADDMLVLVDGRTVYSPLFAGVFWEAQDTPLEDIERIEVTRGPGGMLWGANATNGSVHIITRHAKETQGGLLSAGGGTQERAFGTLRYGGTLGNAQYRLYAKGFARDATAEAVQDDWRKGQLGFRTDWDVTTRDSLTFTGDYYRGDAGQQSTIFTSLGSSTVTEAARLSGGNIGLRWARHLAPNSDLTFQMFYDRTARQEAAFSETRDTFSVDFQHHLLLTARQDVVWGFGHTDTTDHTRADAPITFDPTHRRLLTTSAFVQDELRFLDDRVRLTVGAKYLHHTYAGNLFLPNARILWAPDATHSLWAAVTRSARLPSRFERDGSQIVGQNGEDIVRLIANPNYNSETLWGYELGYRAQFSPKLSADLALFYNSYEKSEAEAELSETIVQMNNNRTVNSYGAEFSAEWQVMDGWRLRPAFTYLQLRHHLAPGNESDDIGMDPAHQFSLRSLLNLSSTVELDTSFRFVDQLPGLHVAAYQALDLRLGWHPRNDVEISLVGQNLFDSRHAEFSPERIQTVPTEIPRGFFAKVTWRF